MTAPDNGLRQTLLHEGEPVDRRGFLGSFSTLAMATGLAAGYGTFVVFAGEYLYPEPDPGAWYYVARLADIEPDGSLSFESPGGVKVVVKRQADDSANKQPGVEQFIALSSICPHLGCRVHWESHNNRFFCPCHNGAFDAAGRPTAGPPKAANQSLPQYPLKVENGLLFIRMPTHVIHGNSQYGTAAGNLRGPREDRV